MQGLYKFFLVLFLLFIGITLYGVNWNLGLLHEENTKFVVSLAAGIVGLILVFVLSTWSKLPAKKEASN